MLQLGKEPLDEVALAVEPLAEARFSAPVALGRDVGRGALVLNQLADAVGVIDLVREHDSARAEMVQQCVDDLPVMRLPRGQAEPDRETLRIDDDVDLGREGGYRLVTLAAVVDFKPFRYHLEKALKFSDGSKGGRPPYDPALMLKVLALHVLYNLSNDQAAFQIRGRLSFIRLLGLAPRCQGNLAVSRASGAGSGDREAIRAARFAARANDFSII